MALNNGLEFIVIWKEYKVKATFVSCNNKWFILPTSDMNEHYNFNKTREKC